MKKNITRVKELLDHNLIKETDLPLIEKTTKLFGISITDQVIRTMDENNPDDPIKLQYVPTTEELNIIQQELDDPIGDDAHSPVKGIVHRYPDRCLLKITNICAVYCRFCFRKELIGPGSDFLNTLELEKAINYIKENKNIWEVIFTGGDPLILTPSKLLQVLSKIEEIEHVKVVRFHTRVPFVKSENISDDLLNVFKKLTKTLYIVVHVNHSVEFTDESVGALKKLSDAGIPLLSQSVLLKGINDSEDVLSELMKNLVINKVKPYYLHHPDYAKGTGHFRKSIGDGQKLMKHLRTNFSGLCYPTYVLDIPGGKGKVPIDYNYLEPLDDQEDNYYVEDHKGQKTKYPL